VALTPKSDWVVVLPVKTLSRAKTRLTELPQDQRAELALAMAEDTAAAALEATSVAGVILVTDDERVIGALTSRHGPRVHVVSDEPPEGLNAAVRRGILAAGNWRPGYGIVVLLADLPALRPAELTDALTTADAHDVIVVADADGSGTTLLASHQSSLLNPQFGPDSLQRHVTTGARPVTHEIPGLRRDVDGLAALADARRLGVGPRTALVADTQRGPVSERTPTLDRD
jgi:2-phospho-L-lactate guanylyltransferase